MTTSNRDATLEQWRIGDLLALPKMNFQPKLKTARLRHLRDNWHIDLCELLTIAESDETGLPAVAEGNHRLAILAEKLGENAMITVRHVHALTAEEVYIGINAGRRTLPGQEKFDASWSAKQEVQLLVEKKANEYGYTVSGLGGKSTGLQRINAAQTLVSIGKNKSGEARLDLTLSIVRAVEDYPGRQRVVGDDNWGKAPVVQAIDYLHMAFGGDMDYSRLVTRLATATPSTAAPVNANSARKNAEHMLNVFYNYNLRGRRLELPTEREMASILRRDAA